MASKRPDVLWKDEALLPGLIATQYDLLRHVLDHSLLPGGLLVYATCSLLKRESEGGETIAQTAWTTWNWCRLRQMKYPDWSASIFSVEGNIRIIPTPLLDATGAELGGDGFLLRG